NQSNSSSPSSKQPWPRPRSSGTGSSASSGNQAKSNQRRQPRQPTSQPSRKPARSTPAHSCEPAGAYGPGPRSGATPATSPSSAEPPASRPEPSTGMTTRLTRSLTPSSNCSVAQNQQSQPSRRPAASGPTETTARSPIEGTHNHASKPILTAQKRSQFRPVRARRDPRPALRPTKQARLHNDRRRPPEGRMHDGPGRPRPRRLHRPRPRRHRQQVHMPGMRTKRVGEAQGPTVLPEVQ